MTLKMMPTDTHPGRLELENAFFCGMAGADCADTVAHVASCESCRAFVDAQHRARTEFLAVHPPAPMLQRALGQLPEAPPRAGVGRALRYVSAAAIALLLTAGLVTMGEQHAPKEDSLRPKGGAALLVMVQEDEGWVEAAPDNSPAAGQEVRFGVRLPQPGYPAIVSVQDDGSTARLYPLSDDEQDQPQVPGRTLVILQGAAVLDAYRGHEELHLLLAAEPWTDSQLDGLPGDLAMGRRAAISLVELR